MKYINFFENRKKIQKSFLLKDDYFVNIKRIDSIDAFRGFCIFCMLIFQFLKNFPSLGILARLANHSLEQGVVILPGMTLADFIAPAFIFAIGLTYCLSFMKRKNKIGLIRAYIHAIQRGLGIIGIGTFLDLCNKYLDMFAGDYQLNVVDITITVFSALALLGLILKLFGLIPNTPYLYKFTVHQFFYCALSCLGIINIVITSIDYYHVTHNEPQIYIYWVTLQGIGFAILVALPFLVLNKWFKFLGFLIIFIAYSIYHQTGNNKVYLDVPVHGGVIGGFGWGAMLLLSMFIAEIYYKNKWISLAVSGIVATLGILLIQPLGNINLGSCSPTFILTTIGMSGMVFALFDFVPIFWKYKFKPFVWWGKNPIVMFLLEFFVLGLFTSIAPDSIIKNAPTWLASIEGIVALVLLTSIAYGLSKSKTSISI